MKNMFEDNDTFWLNLGNTLSRKETEEKTIELRFEARAEELTEVGGLAIITGMMLNTFELPDTEEYDTFSHFLWFCKKLYDALPEKETEATPITLKATEKEIEATDCLLSQAMTIFSRDENMTNVNADKAILIESFRRRIMKAAEYN